MTVAVPLVRQPAPRLAQQTLSPPRPVLRLVPTSTRLASIDALRGFDMFWITGGTNLFLTMFALAAPDVAKVLRVQFDHSAWRGFTFYDLIFPLFIFIAGLVIPFSITARVERGEDRATMYRHVLIRTAVLFAIGVVHNGASLAPFAFRLTGVLQRVAVCSGVASILAIHTKPRVQAWIVVGVLLGYWAVMALVPVPHFGAGNYSPQGNLDGYVDRLVLPFASRWCCYRFGDSEGLLTTIPAVATALLGTLTGHLLRARMKPMDRVRWLLLAGVACLAIGVAWDAVFPINKNLWSSSFVLFAGGWSMLLVAVFHWHIDVNGAAGWAFFFRVIGMNAVVMYLLEAVLRFGFLKALGAGAPLALLIACLDITVRWGLVYLLYRRGWFLKI